MIRLGYMRIINRGTYPSHDVWPNFGLVDIVPCICPEKKIPDISRRFVLMQDSEWPFKWTTIHRFWRIGMDVTTFVQNLTAWTMNNRSMFNVFVMLAVEIEWNLPGMRDHYSSQISPTARMFSELCHHDRTALACVNSEYNKTFRIDTEISPRIRRARAFLDAVDEEFPDVLRYRRVDASYVDQLFDIALCKPSDVVELAEWFVLYNGRGTTPYEFASRKGKREYPKPISAIRRSERISKRRKPS